MTSRVLHNQQRRAIAGLAVLAIVLGACTSSGMAASPVASTASTGAASTPAVGTVPPAASDAGQVVTVELLNSGCTPNPATIPAGPVTFKISNVAADLVFELEVKQGDRILAEKENLVPGISASLFIQLPAGSYTLHCPIAEADSTLTVTATAAGPSGAPNTLDALNQAAVAAYAKYVQDQTALLVDATQKFATAVEAGDVAQAKLLYGPARVFYERIEPVAESFGDLDPAIDARIADVADPTTWTGFHRIEQALWVSNNTTGMGPIATKLVNDVKKLQTLVATETYQPAQLANGASSLLDEVAKSKITGEEEAYSHIDLLDFAANVEGARVAFKLLEPSLKQVNPDLATTIDQRFTDIQAGLQAQVAGDSYKLYPDVPAADIRSLADAVDALAEPLSRVAAAVCNC